MAYIVQVGSDAIDPNVDTSVNVLTGAAKQSHKYFLTLRDANGLSSPVSCHIDPNEIVDGESFIVRCTGTLDRTITFDWMIVNPN